MSLQVFGCPDCAQPFQVDSSQAGQQVRCPGCSAVVQIPEVLGDSPETGLIDPSQPAEPPATEEVPEAFACPACELAFGVLSSMYGTSMACPHCGQPVSIERAPPSPAPAIDERNTPTPDDKARGPEAPPQNKKQRPPKPEAKFDTILKPPVAADARLMATDKPPLSSEAAALTTEEPTTEPDEASVEEEPVAVFEKQNVDHLLPPRFATLDPAFFYRRGNSTDRVLLPQADGGVQAVSNRIVTVVHNGQEYQLISSPRYRRNMDIVVNTVLILIAAVLMMAIWWAVA